MELLTASYYFSALSFYFNNEIVFTYRIKNQRNKFKFYALFLSSIDKYTLENE